jgi:hypothetical protein
MSNEIVAQGETVNEVMSLGTIVDRVNTVHTVMEKVMKNGTHYGTVPGCGQKKVLLKPGADLLAMTFRLTPEYDIQRDNLPNCHREYIVTCSMKAADGSVVASGVGSCSTMEKKYRYRNGAENPDIADVYNTVLKMGKKRAHVDATLTATGAGDMFTQDLIDDAEGIEAADKKMRSHSSKKTASTIADKVKPAEPVAEESGPDFAKLLTEKLKADCDGKKNAMIAIFEEFTGQKSMKGFDKFEELYLDITGPKRQEYIDSLGALGFEEKE